MGTKIAVVCDHPADPAAFEAGYPAGAFLPAVVDLATGGVRILVADVEETRR